MPDLTPAEELRTAAATLKSAARTAGGSEWTADHFPEGTVVRPTDSTHSLFQLHADGIRAAGTPCVSQPVGAWMALMGPGMGPLLADWLEWMVRAEHGASIAIPTEALALARKINAKTKEQP